MGQLVAQEASARLGVPFGIVDLSLAPTPAVGDSVAAHSRGDGAGDLSARHGTTAALALLNDAVKKGGVMASSHVGGLSRRVHPRVSEDAGMIAARAERGALTLEKLEAMTCVCSVGLDMIAVPGDTTRRDASPPSSRTRPPSAWSTTRPPPCASSPPPGKQVGDTVEFGGLLGSAPVMPVNRCSAAEFIARGGRIPAPLHSLKN